MDKRNPSVVSGVVIACRLIDVADMIDLAKAEVLWAQQLRSPVTRGRLVSTPPKAIAFGVPPLEIALSPVRLQLDTDEVEAAASAIPSFFLRDFNAIAFIRGTRLRPLPRGGSSADFHAVMKLRAINNRPARSESRRT